MKRECVFFWLRRRIKSQIRALYSIHKKKFPFWYYCIISGRSILLLKGADARYDATMEDNILTSAQYTWHNSYNSLLRCIVADIIPGSTMFISYDVISISQRANNGFMNKCCPLNYAYVDTSFNCFDFYAYQSQFYLQTLCIEQKGTPPLLIFFPVL